MFQRYPTTSKSQSKVQPVDLRPVSPSRLEQRRFSFDVSSAKDESTSDEKIETQAEPIVNENSSTELPEKSSPNPRLRLAAGSASSISLTLNDSDNNNNNTVIPPQEKSVPEHVDPTNDEQEIAEIINEDEEEIEQIEAVKNDQEGIAFRIRLYGETESKWVAAKIANRKFPQAVIAFWESHVEFT